MGPVSKHFLFFLVTYVTLISIAATAPASRRPAELCEILKKKFPDVTLPECSTIDNEGVRALIETIQKMGYFKDSNRTSISKILSHYLNPIDVSSPDSQEGDAGSQPRPTGSSLLDLKRPFLPPHLKTIPNNKSYTTKSPENDPSRSRKGEEAVSGGLAENEFSRRQIRQFREEELRNVELSLADKLKQKLLKRLPTILNRNQYSPDFDMGKLSSSLWIETVIDKIYEIQMAQFFA